MRTTISISCSPTDATKIKKLAKCRGFQTTSDYVRYLLNEDDVDLLQEEELLRLSRSADKLHKSGKLVKADSLADLINKV